MQRLENLESLNRLIAKLRELRENNNAIEGFEQAKLFSLKIGAKVSENPDGGIIIFLNDSIVHVWQPYQDIDKIYFEY